LLELAGWVPFVFILFALTLLAWSWSRLMRRCERAHRADWGGKWINRLDGFNRLFCRRFHRLRSEELPLPEEGGALVASNHVSGLDPLLLIAACRRPLRFIIAREQYERWYLKWLFQAVGCIPVERSRNPLAAFHLARDAILRGEVVALFPHGGIHLDHEPAKPLKRGVAVIAGVTGAPVFPARIEGVRGEGLTVAAVFLRSRARIRSFPALQCQSKSLDQCLERLAALIGPN
jgi:1-acyl-sn-glycerol-3-phosphate acyltransferase